MMDEESHQVRSGISRAATRFRFSGEMARNTQEALRLTEQALAASGELGDRLGESEQFKIRELFIILPAACSRRWTASSAFRFFSYRHRPHNTSRKNDRHDPSLHCKLPGLPK